MRFYNKGNINRKDIKMHSLMTFVFVNKTFPMQHKEMNKKINRMVTKWKIRKYVFQWKVLPKGFNLIAVVQ